MIAKEIIAKFELQVDDGSELSLQDELDLLNKVYMDVWTNRPWEFAKKEFANFISGDKIALPVDLAYIIKDDENSIKVGDRKYTIVNWSERGTYKNRSGYCWINIVDSALEFSEQVTGQITYDYVSFPTPLTLLSEPKFPAVYQPILYHLMASDDYMIQQFDKLKSYARENQDKADYWLEKMQIWNANLIV